MVEELPRIVTKTAPTRRCYIARYPLAEDGLDLREEILFEDTYCSRELSAEWNRLFAAREPNRETEPMLQCWYADNTSTVCLARTNQPFDLP